MKHGFILCCLFSIAAIAFCEKQLNLEDIERDTLASEKQAAQDKTRAAPKSQNVRPVAHGYLPGTQYTAPVTETQQQYVLPGYQTQQLANYIVDNNLQSAQHDQQSQYYTSQIQQPQQFYYIQPVPVPAYSNQGKSALGGVQYVMYIPQGVPAGNYLSAGRQASENYNLRSYVPSYAQLAPHIETQHVTSDLYAQSQSQAAAQATQSHQATTTLYSTQPQQFTNGQSQAYHNQAQQQQQQQQQQYIQQYVQPQTYATQNYAASAYVGQAQDDSQYLAQTEQKYVVPQVKYVEPQVKYTEPQVKYTEPQVKYAETQLKYTEPQAQYVEPQVKYVQPQTNYVPQIKYVPAKQNAILYRQPLTQQVPSQQLVYTNKKEPQSLLDSYVPSLLQLQYLKDNNQQLFSLDFNANKGYTPGVKTAIPTGKSLYYQAGFSPNQGVQHDNGATSYVHYRLGRYAQ